MNQVHDKNFRFKCKQCDQGFTSKGQMKTHVLGVHEKIKPYTCEMCGKSYSQVGALNLHVKTVHEGLKNSYMKQCQFCEHRSAAKSAL